MGYGMSKPNINEKSIVQRKNEESESREIDASILNFEELELDEANAAFMNAYYDDNPHLFHEGIHTTDAPVSKRDQKIHDGYILINQSLIKKLINKFQEEEQFCPKYIKHCVIDRKGLDISTDAMMAGKFFESMTLGGTTGGNLVTDLPRKAISQKKMLELKSKGLPLVGEKKIDQERLEIQVERFKLKAKKLGIQIATGINTHVQVFKHWDGKKYLIVGELDLFPTPILYEGHTQLAIIDVKATSNVDTTFGKFCWGTPKFMDHLQADMYHYLIRGLDFGLNPHLKGVITPAIQELIENNQVLFLYWVWGYQKEPLELQEKFIERSYFDENGSNYRQKELQERIRKTIAIIEREDAFGWEANPIPEQCKVCSLNRVNGGTCSLSINSKV